MSEQPTDPRDPHTPPSVPHDPSPVTSTVPWTEAELAALTQAILDVWPGPAAIITTSERGAQVTLANAAARHLLGASPHPEAGGEERLAHILTSGIARQLPLAVGDDTMRLALLLAAEQPRPIPPPEWALSNRQKAVLEAVVRGETNKGIAASLAISVSMTEQHLAALFRKAGVKSRHELIAAFWLAQPRWGETRVR